MTRQETGVLAFTATYMILGAYRACASANHEFQFYLVTMVLLITAVLVVHRHIRLSPGLLWGLSLWGALHLIGGMVTLPDGLAVSGTKHVWYNWWLIPERLRYDQVVHAFGFGMTTWLCWQALTAAMARRHPARQPLRPTWGLAVLCMAAGMGFGALNEVVEFAATLTVPDTNVGGYENTGWDLVANLVGASMAMLLIAATASRKTHASPRETSSR